MRTLFDTNVLVSRLLIGDAPDSTVARVIDHAVRGTYTLLLSEDVLDELYSLRGKRKYLRDRITEQDIDDLVLVLRSIAKIIPHQIGSIPAVLRDPKDDFLLVAAAIGNADYLVTGDRDLLVIRDDLDQPKICTVTEFLEILSVDR